MAQTFYLNNSAFHLLLGADELNGVEIWDIPITEQFPRCQILTAPTTRFYRVLSGSVHLAVGEDKTFTMHSTTSENESVIVPASLDVLMRNGANWQGSRLQMLSVGGSLEKLMKQIASPTSGAPLHPATESIAKKWGYKIHVVETVEARISQYRIPQNQQYGV